MIAGGYELTFIFGLFLILLCVGLWVPLAILIPALFYLYLHGGVNALRGIGLVSWGSMDRFTLTAAPLFIFMAQIMQQSGLSTRVYNGLSKLVGRFPGGLLKTNIVGCAVFAATTGSSIATAASIGSVALPQLVSRRYARALSAGSLAAGGTLGILLPPSLAMIIYGSLTETSIVKLFMAGVIPGLLLAALFMIYIGVHSAIYPDSAPVDRVRYTAAQYLMAIADILPFVVLISFTMGGMYLGFITPTEAGAIGCLVGIAISIIWGDLNWRLFVAAIRKTVSVLGNILFIIYAAYIFSYAISFAGVGNTVTTALVALHLGKEGFFLALFILYTVLGALIEGIGMIVITVPLLFPVLQQYDVNPIWFGVILVLFVELGQISPPIGINLFVIQSIWDGDLSEVIFGTIPFHLILFGLLFLLVLWPELALWLPSQIARFH